MTIPDCPGMVGTTSVDAFPGFLSGRRTGRAPRCRMCVHPSCRKNSIICVCVCHLCFCLCICVSATLLPLCKRSPTRLRLIALFWNVRESVEDNDHVDLLDHNAFDYVGMPLIMDPILWEHARALELSASPIKRSHADKSFVPKTILLVVCITDTSQGISVEISRSVPNQRWQCVPFHNFGSVQNRSDCVHGNSKMTLLPAKISSHQLGTS